MKSLQASILAAISPNVNFCNPSHKVTFKCPFSKQFQQAHLSATSFDIGLLPHYKNRYNLTGGVAIITTDQWASKVHSTQQDNRSHGSFTITTLQGRNGKLLSIIAAYISVEKGKIFGPNTVHAQQLYIMEKEAHKAKQ